MAKVVLSNQERAIMALVAAVEEIARAAQEGKDAMQFHAANVRSFAEQARSFMHEAAKEATIQL